ncbi:MAG TPA: 4-(cytidine 5'-diphospho)-2-C-methyl-D-erythritol kinase [Gammaproteobacteria bacterium]|nr:4-(cytidine 5'-diphospho)-2-C-methyl-D-erythritol kinase [Gammaproteobacteria bacterium]
MSVSWPAPAKLNLFIHIVGRRPDGYHLLQTVFQFIDLVDELRIEVRADGLIRRTAGLASIAPEDDLVVRAARRLKAATGTPLGADIAVTKRIPAGAGLGGGSSDAATALVALNALWGTGLGLAELARLGGELGADVPVFVRGQACWAEGIGEELTPLTLPEPWYLVVKPPVEVATREIYAAPELTRNCPPLTIPGFLAGAGGNVFTPVVCARYPLVAEALRWLGRHAPARLTGTGACVFAAFGARAEAEWVKRRVPHGWQAFVVRGLNRSPLREYLDYY